MDEQGLAGTTQSHPKPHHGTCKKVWHGVPILVFPHEHSTGSRTGSLLFPPPALYSEGEKLHSTLPAPSQLAGTLPACWKTCW